MPLTTYTPRVQHEGYDLINQAFNRFVAGQQPKLPQSDSRGGGALSGAPSGQQASLQTAGPPGPAQQSQVPDFFNRPQTPAYQAPQGSTAAGPGPSAQPAPGGQPQGPQGGLGNLGALLGLLGPLQSAQGFLPSLFAGQTQPGGFGLYQKPMLFPGMLQQQASQYGNVQGTPLASLFQPGSYSGPAQYGMHGPSFGGMNGGGPGGIQLDPGVRQQALTYILSQLATGGQPQQGQPQGA